MSQVSSFAKERFCLLFWGKKMFMSAGSSSFTSEPRQRQFYYCRPSNKLFYLFIEHELKAPVRALSIFPRSFPSLAFQLIIKQKKARKIELN